MALSWTQSRYPTTRLQNIKVDLTGAGRNLLAASANRGKALGTYVDNLKADKEKQAALELAATQRDIENKRADARLGMQQDAATIVKAREADRVTGLNNAKAQEDALSNVLTNLGTGSTSTITTKSGGRKGNQGDIAAVRKRNKAIEQQQEALGTERDAAAVKYDELFGKYTAQPVTGKEQYGNTLREKLGLPTDNLPKDSRDALASTNEVVVKDYKNVPGSARHTYYETIDGRKLDATNIGDYHIVDKFSAAPTTDVEAIISKQADLANAKAMEESGMNTIVDRYNAMKGTEKVPKLIPGKAPTTVQKEVFKKFTNAEKADNFRKAIIEDKTLTGTAKMNALKSADKLFPVKEVKGPSITEQLALAKYKNGILSDAQTVADYRSMFPKMPANIKTVKGAKAYADNKSKAKGKGFNLANELYSTMTGTDAGDIAAIDKFLIDNQSKLSLLPPAEQKALATKYAAKYKEEGYWDLTNIFGGSAAGDAFAK